MTFEDNVRILREEVLRANSFVRYLLVRFSLSAHLFNVFNINRVSLVNQLDCLHASIRQLSDNVIKYIKCF